MSPTHGPPVRYNPVCACGHTYHAHGINGLSGGPCATGRTTPDACPCRSFEEPTVPAVDRWDDLPEQCKRILYAITRDPAVRNRSWTTTEVQQAVARMGHNVTRDTIARWLTRMTATRKRPGSAGVAAAPYGNLIRRWGATSVGEHSWKPTDDAWALVGAVFGPGTATPDSAGQYRCVAERPRNWMSGRHVEYVWHLLPDGRDSNGAFAPIICGQARDEGINLPGPAERRQPTCPACLAVAHGA